MNDIKVQVSTTSKKLQGAIEKAHARGVSDEQIATAIIHAKQGIKYSERNPSKVNPAVPSYVEDAIAKVCGVEPPDKEIYIGANPDKDAVIDAVLNRRKIVDTAMILNPRISVDRLRLYADAIFNDGFAIETIKKIAVHDNSPETANSVADIFDTAGIAFPTIDDAEGVATVARAILRHVMTHHKGEVAFADTITPFMAWRIKERILTGMLQTERKRVLVDGYDSTKQMDEFDANFSKADVVLWNTDIWKAATRKCEIFAGTKVDKAILDACMPMFWQFEHQFNLPSGIYFDLSMAQYYCAGLVILPHSEMHCKAFFQPEDVKVVKEDGDDVEIKLLPTKGTKKSLDEAHSNPALQFLRQGVSVSLIFLPFTGDDPPEIRYLRPIYDGELIEKDWTFQQAILAAMQFLTLDFVSKDGAKISKKELKEDRALFKQVRKGKVNVPPIKIINLRRIARKEKAERDPSKPKRGFSCHWLTEPHWQRYHYADGRVIRKYKSTYINGDPTKPFRPPREKIFKAVR